MICKVTILVRVWPYLVSFKKSNKSHCIAFSIIFLTQQQSFTKNANVTTHIFLKIENHSEIKKHLPDLHLVNVFN